MTPGTCACGAPLPTRAEMTLAGDECIRDLTTVLVAVARPTLSRQLLESTLAQLSARLLRTVVMVHMCRACAIAAITDAGTSIAARQLGG